MHGWNNNGLCDDEARVHADSYVRMIATSGSKFPCLQIEGITKHTIGMDDDLDDIQTDEFWRERVLHSSPKT